MAFESGNPHVWGLPGWCLKTAEELPVVFKHYLHWFSDAGALTFKCLLLLYWGPCWGERGVIWFVYLGIVCHGRLFFGGTGPLSNFSRLGALGLNNCIQKYFLIM